MPAILPLTTPVPLPNDWARLHALLNHARSGNGREAIPAPPVPLILAGAAFSTADAIRQRWIDLLKWSIAYGFSELLLANLPPAPIRDVAEDIAGVSCDGQGWWPTFGEQFHPKKQKYPRPVVITTLNLLKQNWPQIVGAELGINARPLRFTGKKYRRLLVAANSAFRPPWGHWSSAYANPRAFTAFRQSINSFIAPLGVDDVDFATAHWPKEDQLPTEL